MRAGLFLSLLLLFAAPGCTPAARQDASVTEEVDDSAARDTATAQADSLATPDTSTTMTQQQPGHEAVAHKFDAALRLRLGEASGSSAEDPIQCLIQLEENSGPAQHEQLEAAGLRVISTAGGIATVEGDAAALRRAAALDFVRSISLSQTRGLR